MSQINASATGVTIIGDTSLQLELQTSGTTRATISAAGDVASTTVTASGLVKGSRVESTIATGTAPLAVASTTKVTNLNADLIDGFSASQTPGADQAVVLNASGDMVLPKVTALFDGRLYGTALHNNAGAVTGTVNQYIASGTYTPSFTAAANCSGLTAYVSSWIRVGNCVQVFGQVDVTTTTTLLATAFTCSLPIASTPDVFQAGGTCTGAATKNSFGIHGDSGSGKARFVQTGNVDTGANGYLFNFSYLVT